MLGDSVSSALTLVGVTQQRVSAWLGRPCRCPEYVEKLNQLDRWTRRVVNGKIEQASHYLEQILSS